VNTQNEARTTGAARLSRPLPGWQPGQGLARMTAAAAPVMYTPDGMRLFLVAAPAAIIAALLAAASTKGNTSPVATALAPGQPGNMPGTPAGWPHVSPAWAPRVQAGKREVEPACQRGPVPSLASVWSSI
jgi:hypothetical protein